MTDRGRGTPQVDVALTFDFDGLSSYIALGQIPEHGLAR